MNSVVGQRLCGRPVSPDYCIAQFVLFSCTTQIVCSSSFYYIEELL